MRASKATTNVPRNCRLLAGIVNFVSPPADAPRPPFAKITPAQETNESECKNGSKSQQWIGKKVVQKGTHSPVYILVITAAGASCLWNLSWSKDFRATYAKEWG